MANKNPTNKAKELIKDQEKALPKKTTKKMAEKKPKNGFKDTGKKEFVEDNPNGKEDFENLLKAFVKPRK
jgi:hypothetical protein